jgi:hypothetical protein
VIIQLIIRFVYKRTYFAGYQQANYVRVAALEPRHHNQTRTCAGARPVTGAATIRANQMAGALPWLCSPCLALTLPSNIVTEWVSAAHLRGA